MRRIGPEDFAGAVVFLAAGGRWTTRVAEGHDARSFALGFHPTVQIVKIRRTGTLGDMVSWADELDDSISLNAMAIPAAVAPGPW